MLKRLAASAAALVFGAALTVAWSPGTALADCKVIDKVAVCDASDADHQGGSGSGSNGSGNGGATGPNNGCQNQGNGIPGQGCLNNPPGPVQQIPSIDLAWDARGLLEPPPPRIRWSPEPRTYVRLRTGLWVEPAGFAPLHTEPPVEAGGQTVTAFATPKRVEWNLVETTIQCRSAGSPDGTQCGYSYQRSSAAQPGGRYQITATVVWDVTWTCEGANCDSDGGDLADITMTSTAQLPVDEIQTESQPG
ncbi:MAG TPA: hypothetical protein VFU43_13600 [Streptosporangiaceae bacterium]|nr:hypothetical protein [Streptosporangiaceae bacterium]